MKNPLIFNLWKKSEKINFSSTNLFRGQKLKVALKFQITSIDKASFRFKSGAYTLVREHFEGAHNAAMEQNMRFC